MPKAHKHCKLQFEDVVAAERRINTIRKLTAACPICVRWATLLLLSCWLILKLAQQHHIILHSTSTSLSTPKLTELLSYVALKPHKTTNQVAMMASIGLVGQHFLKFPGFENSPAGFSIMGRGEGVLGFFAIFLVSGLLELAWREDPSGEKEPGNYGDPFGVQMYNDEMRMKELNNGRMAMISVLGIFAAECATGKDAIEQFGFWVAWPFSLPFSVLCCITLGTVWANFRPCRTACRPPFHTNLQLNLAPRF